MPAKTKDRRRAVITDKVRKGIIAEIKKGGSPAKIAKTFGISIPSVNNIKKAAGLVKPRADEQTTEEWLKEDRRFRREWVDGLKQAVTAYMAEQPKPKRKTK